MTRKKPNVPLRVENGVPVAGYSRLPKKGQKVISAAPQRQRSGSVRALANAVNRLVAGSTKIEGRGGYVRDALVGGAGYLGDRIEGTTLGQGVNAIASRLIGRGAYTLRRNDIMKDSTQMPKIAATKDYIEVEINEFGFNVPATGSTAFAIVQVLDVQAALSTTFAKFSQLAMNFETVEFYSLVAVYEPTSGELSATQGLGDVTLAHQTDMADAPFTSEREMKDYEFATACKPSAMMMHPIECNPRNNPLALLYTRVGLLPNTGITTTVDPRYNAYDLCRLSCAVTGCPAAAGVVLGKVYFVGKARLRTPKLFVGIGSEIVHDTFNSLTPTFGGGVITSFDATTASATSNIGGAFGVDGVTYFWGGNGRWKSSTQWFVFHIQVQQTAGSATYTPANVVATNCTVQYYVNSYATNNCTSFNVTVWVQLAGTGSPSINFAPAIGMGGAAGAAGTTFSVQASYPGSA